jgi:hypothetical protein
MDKLSIILELLGMLSLVVLAIGIILSVVIPIEMCQEAASSAAANRKDDSDEPQ